MYLASGRSRAPVLPADVLPAGGSMPALRQLLIRWEGAASLSFEGAPSLPCLEEFTLQHAHLGKPLSDARHQLRPATQPLTFTCWGGSLEAHIDAAWLPACTTQLRLVGCLTPAGHAGHVPPVVRHLPALQRYAACCRAWLPPLLLCCARPPLPAWAEPRTSPDLPCLLPIGAG